MSISARITVLIILALLPTVLSYALEKPWENIAQAAGYYSALVLLYITWRYVDATQSILHHAETQADAAQEQAGIAHAQIEATQATLKAAERDRAERFKPVLVPLTDMRSFRNKLGETRFSGAPIAIENVGSAAALNISVRAEFNGGYASNQTQPFKLPSLAAGYSHYLGDLTNIGNNPPEFVIQAAGYRIACNDILGNSYEFECKDGVLSEKRASAS